MQTPTVCRFVIALVDPATNNGSDLAPAVITRAWGPSMVNVKVLNDGPDNEWKTSVSLHDTEDEARATGGHSVFWPPAVL